MTYDKYYLHNAYNATSTTNDIGELESYKEWLERQLLSRIKEMNQPPSVRPMSELPKTVNKPFNAVFVLEGEEGTKHLEVGYSIEGDYVNILSDIYLRRKYWERENLKIIGWLYELPNPNDIKIT